MLILQEDKDVYDLLALYLFLASVHESFITNILAGFLTYSFFEHPSHSL